MTEPAHTERAHASKSTHLDGAKNRGTLIGPTSGGRGSGFTLALAERGLLHLLPDHDLPPFEIEGVPAHRSARCSSDRVVASVAQDAVRPLVFCPVPERVCDQDPRALFPLADVD